MRLSARVPRYAVVVCVAVLSAAGLRSMLEPARATPQRPTAATTGVAARGFAEGFARAYLTWDAERPELRERELARFVPAGVEVALEPPRAGRQRVLWTAAVAGPRHGIVTVAAQTTSGPIHLAVPVQRDRDRFLFVASPPAVVGAPPVARSATPPVEREVEDPALRDVAERVVRNYLAGERENLAADLDSRAVVSLPDLRLTVRSVETVTWTSARSRVAVALTAQERDGLRLALRYELAVTRRAGRWLVTTVHVRPTSSEASP